MNDDDRTVIWDGIKALLEEETKRRPMTLDERKCFIKLEVDKIPIDERLELYYFNQSGPGKYQQSDEEAGLIKVEER